MEKDRLQVKIYQARALLSSDARDAIDNIPWRGGILKMKETKGYSFEQVENLETETDLLLCGLISTTDYPLELEKRMSIQKTEVDSLIKEMDEIAFKPIKELLFEKINKSVSKLSEFTNKFGKSGLLGIALASKKAIDTNIINVDEKEISTENKDHEDIFKLAGIEIMSVNDAMKTRPVENKKVENKLAGIKTEKREDLTKGPKEITAPEHKEEIEKSDDLTEISAPKPTVL